MLNQRTESNPLRSSLALKIRCAMYPPPPGSAPGYQKDHHCTPILTKNVTTGRTHNASAEIGREKSGKNDVASPAPGDAARISPSLLNSAAIDRKSTRLNSSHRCISYAVFCLKK